MKNEAKPMPVSLAEERELEAKSSLVRVGNWLVEYSMYVVFIVLIVVSTILSPYFLSWANFTNILRQVSFNGIISIGMCMVILMRGIDLSVGSTLGLSAVLVAGFADWGFWGVLALAIVVGFAIGAFNGLMVTKVKIEPFVATLGTLIIGRGLGYIYTQGVLIPNITQFRFIGAGYLFGMPIPALIMICFFAIAFFIQTSTVFGRRCYAVGGNPEAAKMAGINTSLYLFLSYVMSGVLAAFAGLIMTARMTTGEPSAGFMFELDAIAAVVMGGTTFHGGRGGIIGTIFGVLILGIIANILNLLNVSSYTQMVIKGFFLIFAVVLAEIRKMVTAAR
jgi:ribose/xylose/arabinose/galactoside ABC-type transport system permease subunit